jgi:ABC-type phosphate transport system ATPase subunit
MESLIDMPSSHADSFATTRIENKYATFKKECTIISSEELFQE